MNEEYETRFISPNQQVRILIWLQYMTVIEMCNVIIFLRYNNMIMTVIDYSSVC